MEMLRNFVAALAIVLVSSLPAAAQSVDRHAGYYYPEPVTVETFTSRAKIMKGVNRATRIGFVTGLTAQQSEQPYPLQTAIFAKGAEADKLILVSLSEGRMNTLYRARAVLALMTAMARTTDVFNTYRVETVFTFLDLCKMLGFRQLTISDGKTFSHQFRFE